MNFEFCLLKMAGDDDYEIPESGAVFTFGRSRFADNAPSHFFIRNDPVVEISCGDEHTALVCQSGRVFLFGHNDYGQLGFGHTKVLNKPSCLKYLKPFHSTHIACGKGHTIVSTACARIFTFGCNSDGQLGTGDLIDRMVPQMITTGLSEEDSISAVAAGCHHTAFLTGKGEIYLWGSNSDGQCGVVGVSYLDTPQKLEFDQQIVSISCGYYHTAFISLGNVYTFGEEDNGKLGRSRETSKTLPEKVDIPENCTLVKCGGSHTMVLTESGEVFAFGSNFSGQLGIGTFDTECSNPTRVKFPESSIKVTYISCGESHTAFVTENGTLYTCGDSRHGKLCNDDESTNFIFPNLITLFENYYCTSVSCGGCHTMVLAKVRVNENDTFSSFSQNKEVLPPLKTKKELSNINDNANIETDEKTETQLQLNGEECENKSNTEINVNNEEVAAHLDEIYTEIEEIATARSENTEEIKNVVNVDSGLINLTSENDLVVGKTKSTMKKFLNIFKKKKSIGAILLDEKPTEAKETDCKTIENQQTSRTCIII